MSLRTLPEMNAPQPRRPFQFDLAPEVLARWDGAIRFESDGDNVVSILGVIGADFWSDSVTPKMIERRLKEIGNRDVVVNINSPGGDFWDGQAIFNMLRLHPGQVTVRVLGVAASAASVIAMAGDRIEMPAASWLMIHNTWSLAVGDRHALTDLAADLAKFDRVSAELYAARTGGDVEAIAKMMDAQTFMGGKEAVAEGFADEVIDPVKSTTAGEDGAKNALRRMEVIMQRAGLSRGDRRALIKELQAKPSAGREDGTPSATEEPASFDAADLDTIRQMSTTLGELSNTLRK